MSPAIVIMLNSTFQDIRYPNKIGNKKIYSNVIFIKHIFRRLLSSNKLGDISESI